MKNNKLQMIDSDYKNRHLKTQSFRQWLRFFKNEMFRCKIIPINVIFYGEINVVNYKNGFKFALIKAASQQIFCNDLYNMVCVIFSKGSFSWGQGDISGELPLGGFVVLDGNETIRYKNSSDNEIIICLIPYFYFKSCNIKCICITTDSVYSDCVYTLIESMLVSKKNRLFKMQAVANLLVLIFSEDKEITSENKECQKVIDFIKDNALNSWLDMDYISTSLGVSKSKIHKLLKSNGISYSYLVKGLRVVELEKKISHERNKTLTQLCYECGFNSISNANIQFKSIKKISISEYKNTLNKVS
ncbi:hypothetical protein UA38_20060 [Photobacterium kishitanii]|uniref:AraC family transcriptional regulator n=2 Tax=Photobacterium kishitanii TaxID=318456 RepID=A0AAX0YRU3_9GAMM|nr:AraC family transcriptional regulator [Photobacterium kishitanii]KJG55379.1 hypothetical protein UA38_20060 [Photobacterium kishitanii]PSX16849.1 AraC family transcriptional regulator [Photobacterium kishitanii]PSX26610.1 AraC family transcriptional regulator [Photobacterium kishitanii]PSX29096.1 AraC family transcriptional regulator [Photobacterium kishitanii]PSX39058.1 AraC family transcriptional regulator [Photobacterium kishitanii]